jgi:hypothetical protein
MLTNTWRACTRAGAIPIRHTQATTAGQTHGGPHRLILRTKADGGDIHGAKNSGGTGGASDSEGELTDSASLSASESGADGSA